MARAQPTRGGLTFGGRIPWSVGLLLVLTIVCSVIGATSSRHGPPIFELGALVPSEVWRGQVWRLATWSFLEDSVLGLIFGCIGLYWLGRDLAREWGERERRISMNGNSRNISNPLIRCKIDTKAARGMR